MTIFFLTGNFDLTGVVDLRAGGRLPISSDHSMNARKGVHQGWKNPGYF